MLKWFKGVLKGIVSPELPGERGETVWTMVFALMCLVVATFFGVLIPLEMTLSHSQETKIVVVDHKQAVPAYTTGCHPESYHLYCNTSGGTIDVAVAKEIFDELEVGDHVRLEYTRTRIFRDLKRLIVEKYTR